jgi:hypothetical protein
LKPTKQLNIFDQIDYVDQDGNIQRCEICGISIEKGEICSDECGKKWLELVFPKTD